ncbi:unnamed protein product [Paramecium sonneborni]|uniref:Uncharacterized protein n=1 Tax=Paramecium sonneborni TaxID=65129 RepID=A0A8S1ML47_9CILI|nr:unnamed protein product [Paramecium sonneborni]
MDYESLKKILSSNNTYNGVKEYMEAVQQQRMDIITLCADVIINILTDNQQGSHYSKFLCLKFINELFELQEYEWIEMAQKRILPILEDFAMFRKESQDDERGKQLFLQQSMKKYEQIKELEQVGYIFHRYTLESIWVWSKWFPLDTAIGKLSLYKIAQERLSIMKVKFPCLSYFTIKQVINHQQIQRPPKELLQECTLLIKEHLQDALKTDLSAFQSSLIKTYFTNTNHNLQSIKTYPQIFKNALDLIKQGKLGTEIQNKIKSAQINQMGKKLLQATKNLKQSRGAFSESIFGFTQIIGEKEKLLSEISAHIIEKDQLNNQLFNQKQKNQELIQEIERLKQSIAQQQILNNQQSTNSFYQLNNTQNQEFLKGQDKLIQKKDQEIKKLKDLNQNYQEIIEQLKNSLDLVQNMHYQNDIERFELQQKKIELELKCDELQSQLQIAQKQIERQTENIKQLQQSMIKLNQECLINYDKQSSQIQQLLNDYAALAQITQQLKDQNEQQKLEIELHKNEKENLKQQILKITKQHDLGQIQKQQMSKIKTEKPDSSFYGQSQINYDQFYQKQHYQDNFQMEFKQKNIEEINQKQF